MGAFWLGTLAGFIVAENSGIWKAQMSLPLDKEKSNEGSFKVQGTPLLTTRSRGAAFQVLVNYWELSPQDYDSYLDSVIAQGFSSLCAFVPWSHFETDIHHHLSKFIKSVATKNLEMRLIVGPSLGVSYPYSGIPRDLLSQSQNLAVSKTGSYFYNTGSPNIFALPSLFSQDVQKRYYAFLIRFVTSLESLLNQMDRKNFCRVLLTQSFLNCYLDPFEEPVHGGDFSTAHLVAFREFLESQFSGAKSEIFKTQRYENTNRHRFLSISQNQFQEKAYNFFQRRALQNLCDRTQIFYPEAHPQLKLASLYSELFKSKGRVLDYLQVLSETGAWGDSVVLSSQNLLRSFQEKERVFLVLSSFLFSESVYLPFEEYLKIPERVLSKIQSICEMIRNEDYCPVRPIGILSSSLFSVDLKLKKAMQALAPHMISYLSDRDHQDSKAAALKVIFVDTNMILNDLDLQRLLSLVQSGSFVVIPESRDEDMSMTSDARQKLKQWIQGQKPPLSLKAGVDMSCYSLSSGGALCIYKTPVTSSLEMVELVKAILSMGEVIPPLRINDGRIQSLAMESRKDPRKRILFLMNPTAEAMTTKINFTGAVDLWIQDEGQFMQGRTFELSVPALGILPLQIRETGNPGDLIQWN